VGQLLLLINTRSLLHLAFPDITSDSVLSLNQVTYMPGDDFPSYMETDGHSRRQLDEENSTNDDAQRRSRLAADNNEDVVGKGSDNEMEFVIVSDEFRDEERSDWKKVDETRLKNKFLLSPLGMTTDSSGKEEGSESVIRHIICHYNCGLTISYFVLIPKHSFRQTVRFDCDSL